MPGAPRSALRSFGSADIGYTASSPMLIAREQGQPFRFFMSMEYEQSPERLWGLHDRDGKIRDQVGQGSRGKTIAVGVPGGLLRTRGARLDGQRWRRLRSCQGSQQPFPQMPAMLDVGTADAACIVEPFATAALAGKSKPVILGRGYLANVTQPYRIAGLFATEGWIKSHSQDIAALMKAYTRCDRIEEQTRRW